MLSTAEVWHDREGPSPCAARQGLRHGVPDLHNATKLVAHCALWTSAEAVFLLAMEGSGYAALTDPRDEWRMPWHALRKGTRQASATVELALPGAPVAPLGGRREATQGGFTSG